MSRHIAFKEEPISFGSSMDYPSDDDDDDLAAVFSSEEDDEYDKEQPPASSLREREARAADRLSVRLLAIHDDDSVEEDRILRKSLRLLAPVDEEDEFGEEAESSRRFRQQAQAVKESIRFEQESAVKREKVIWTLIAWAAAGLAVVVVALVYLGKVVGPPNQPVGPYTLIERQEGENFFPYYNFYEGPDSVGSNGFLNYVNREHAESREILNVTYEKDPLDDLFHPPRSYDEEGRSTASSGERSPKPFIYMGSAPTEAGPRDSIRLEGVRRFNRGLFM